MSVSLSTYVLYKAYDSEERRREDSHIKFLQKFLFRRNGTLKQLCANFKKFCVAFLLGNIIKY